MDNSISRRNWRYFLLHGLFYSLKRRLAPPKVFLPFICVAAGAPVFLAAVIVPVYNIATRSAELVSAPLISSARQRKSYVMLGIAGIATGLLLAIVAIEVSFPALTAICLAVAAVVIGLSRGLGGLAYASLLPSLFDKQSRTNLLNLEGVLGACAAIVVAFAAYHLLRGQDAIHGHVALAWLAFAMAFPAALLLLLVVEPGRQLAGAGASVEVQANKRRIKEIVSKFTYCWRHDWFRRYLTAQILMLSVTQVMPFYAIHAASLHKDQHGSYAAFVIAMSFGAILSGPILYVLTSRSVAVNLTTSIVVAMAAAALALVVDMIVTDPTFYYYVPVLVLVALAGQVSSVAMSVTLGEMAGDSDREYFIATSRFASGIVAIVFATVLGVLAQIHDEAIPIAIILGVNVLTLFIVLRILPVSSGEEGTSAHASDPAG